MAVNYNEGNCMSKLIFQERNKSNDKDPETVIRQILNDVKNNQLTRSKSLAAYYDLQSIFSVGNVDGMKDIFTITETAVNEICEEFRQKIESEAHERTITVYMESWVSLIDCASRADIFFRRFKQAAGFSCIQDGRNWSLYNLALKRWATLVTEIKELLADGLLSILDMDRNGESTLETIKTFTESVIEANEFERDNVIEVDFEGIELYETIEDPLIKKLELYYTDMATKYFSSLAIDDSISKCAEMIVNEETLLRKMLPLSAEKIVGRTWSIVASDKVEQVLERTKYYIRYGDIEHLKMAHTIFKYSSAAKARVIPWIQEKVEQIFTDLREEIDGTKFCDNFMIVYETQYELLKSIFGSYPASFAALDKGIVEIVNNKYDEKNSEKVKSIPRVIDILINDFDKFMRSGTKGLNESQIEKKINDIITIFNYIEEKDLYMQLYSKRLAMRLIKSESQSKEGEEMMVNKMKIKCGNAFVTKVEKMLTDAELSKELTSKFNNPLPISFNILVAQTGSWPIHASKTTLLVPEVMSQGMTAFNDFYSKQYAGRRLHWNHGQSTCDIKLNYLSKSYTVQTSVIMATIWTLFNNAQSLTFEEIRVLSDIDAKDLQKYLQFLAAQNILSKSNEETDAPEKFSLNYQYENKKPKFKLVAVLKQAVEEAEEERKHIIEERKFFLQALIVRIMKAKKTMSHKDLVKEAIEQSITNFIPSQPLIKLVIDELIAKEYLARVEGENNKYNYLA